MAYPSGLSLIRRLRNKCILDQPHLNLVSKARLVFGQSFNWLHRLADIKNAPFGIQQHVNRAFRRARAYFAPPFFSIQSSIIWSSTALSFKPRSSANF